MTPSVSVVLRNRNEATHLRHVLRAVYAQTLIPEVVVVDNESTDESREVAESFGARVISISRADFSYGRALNRGIEAAQADIIMNLSAHALPLGKRFIESLLMYFDDPAVAAVRCPNVQFMDDRFDWMAGKELTGDVQWSEVYQHMIENACCGIRRSAWETIPFDESLRYAEDAWWTYQVCRAGGVIKMSDCYYWYMRRRRWRELPRLRYLLALEEYRFGATPRLHLSLGDVFRSCFFGIPKTALWSMSDVIGQYAALRIAKYVARKHPFHPSEEPKVTTTIRR